jgi:hypothetical protein
MAREMFHEAKGALDMALSSEHVRGEEAGMHAMCYCARGSRQERG